MDKANRGKSGVLLQEEGGYPASLTMPRARGKILTATAREINRTSAGAQSPAGAHR